MKTSMKTALLLFLLAALFFSCSVKQDLSVEISGEGSGRMEIQLQPVLVDYLTDLAAVMSDNPHPETLPLFDEAGIWTAFAGSPGIELLSVSIPRRDTLILEFRFSDLNQPFLNLPPARRNLISFTRRGSLGILDVYLSAENFFQAAAYFPLMDDDVLSYFGPNPENPVSEEIYREDLELALEDYLGPAGIDGVLRTSNVSLHVKTGGEIVSVTGGRRESGGAVFETPLIRYLTLKTPIEYHLEFRIR